jgi:hypothetical protein
VLGFSGTGATGVVISMGFVLVRLTTEEYVEVKVE